MTDYTYSSADYAAPEGRNVATMANWAGAAVSLALLVGVGVWGYKLLVRDVSGIPVVQAMDGPMRVAPEDPGGLAADHQGLAVNNVAGQGKAAPPPDRLMLAPRAAGLGEEDVALGVLAPLAQAEPQPAALTQEVPAAPADTPVETAEAAPAPEPGDAADAILALAEQLAAGATPLTELAPGDDVPVQTSLDGVTPNARPETLEAAAPKPGPGLARSLRPKTRPANLAQVASTAPLLAVVPAGPVEKDALSLPKGTQLAQIGVFGDPEDARKEWARLESRFGDYLDGKDRVIQKASSGGRTFYRLRAHGFADIADARRFCAAFVAGKVDCIPVVTR